MIGEKMATIAVNLPQLLVNNPRNLKSKAKIDRRGQEAAYRASLELVTRIDEDLSRGRRHYWNRSGILLTCLDEVVEAILSGNLDEAGQ
jgi:hypothetical protein